MARDGLGAQRRKELFRIRGIQPHVRIISYQVSDKALSLLPLAAVITQGRNISINYHTLRDCRWCRPAPPCAINTIQSQLIRTNAYTTRQ